MPRLIPPSHAPIHCAGLQEPPLCTIPRLTLSPPPHALIHCAGLKLKLQNQNSVLQCFSYALFPSMGRSTPVGWQYLVTEDEEAENIRLHELVKGEELATLLDGFKQSYAKAAVLINTEDSYEVAEGFVTGVKDIPFPLLVVRRSDGDEILRCLERHSGDSVYARVDAENQVDGGVEKLPQQALLAQKASEPMASISESPNKYPHFPN